jgi:hypothetical protein
MQKSFANHWVMLYERNGNLVLRRRLGKKIVRRTRHFCRRVPASRFSESGIATPVMGAISDGAGGFDPQKAAQSLGLPQGLLDAEDEAMAAELVAKYG